MEEKILWDFELQNISDYIITFSMMANSKMFDFIFTKAIEKLRKQTNKDIEIDLTKIQQFEIDERYYNLLNTILKKNFRAVAAEVRKDNYILLNSKVENAVFSKKTDSTGWDIKVRMVGQYARG